MSLLERLAQPKETLVRSFFARVVFYYVLGYALWLELNLAFIWHLAPREFASALTESFVFSGPAILFDGVMRLKNLKKDGAKPPKAASALLFVPETLALMFVIAAVLFMTGAVKLRM